MFFPISKFVITTATYLILILGGLDSLPFSLYPIGILYGVILI
jgi:hypothetical protein